MSNSVIEQFINLVVYDHAMVTGLKACETDQDIVDYAASRDYVCLLYTSDAADE